jgi:hypothetical protein
LSRVSPSHYLCPAQSFQPISDVSDLNRDYRRIAQRDYSSGDS